VLRSFCLPLPCGNSLVFCNTVLCLLTRRVKINPMFEPFALPNITKLVCPRSRRTTTDRRALLWPPDHPPLGARGDSGVQSEAAIPFPGTGEDPAEETGPRIRPAAEKRTLSATERTDLARTNALPLWGQLVWQQIRPRVRSRRRAEQGAGDPPQNRRRSAAEAPSSRTGPAGLRPQEETVLPAVETLFTQLARRRLSRGFTQETRR